MSYKKFEIKCSADKGCCNAIVECGKHLVIEHYDIDTAALGDIKVCISEAVSNVVNHAYLNKKGPRPMLVSFVISTNTFTIVVRDKGVGIADIKKARMPMFTTKHTELSGMGFTIMESFTGSHNNVIIESEAGKGTTLKLKFDMTRYKYLQEEEK